MDELPIRVGTDADWPAIAELLNSAFLEAPDVDDDAAWHHVFEPDRSLVVEDDGGVVAHANAYTRDLTVPGSTLPAAHVSGVAVASTHRRRGLLNRLMHRQMTEAPEPVAVLWASEGRIYPRYGYGLATLRASMKINTREVRLPAADRPEPLRTVPAAQVRPLLARLYESERTSRPGWSHRSARWWDKILADPPGQRRGTTALRTTVHGGPDGPDGYALWRAKGDWTPSGPAGEVRVTEVVATTSTSYLALWRFLLAIDLVRWVKMWMAAPDEPLLHLVDEPRQLGVTLGDGLYLRILDLPAALAGRRYAAGADVVLDVLDPVRAGNSGRWRLIADNSGHTGHTDDSDHATCARTDRPADLACDIAALGAAYLGGTSLGALAAAGRVRELRPGALAEAGAAFGWHRAPAGMETF
jgi:predicted acetyltransferase